MVTATSFRLHARRRERQRRGHISKAESGRARHILVEAAWTTCGGGVIRTRNYTTGARVAVIARARKLAGILNALWRDGAGFTTRVIEPAMQYLLKGKL